MEKALYNLEELIALRRHFHKYANISDEEGPTRDQIIKYFKSKGVDDKSIKHCALTGLVIDLRGTGNKKGEKDKIIAFRADMDALETQEENDDLEYKSVTNGAHLCGHDGHMIGLMGASTLLLQNLSKLPSNHVVRLLFQPCEEKFGGAKRMIEEGCLEGVSEAWGLHNLPWEPKGSIFAKEGVMMSGSIMMQIICEGKGGHSSLKKELSNPVLPITDLNVRIEEILQTKYFDKKEQLIVSFPKIISSQAPNIIPDKCSLEGMIRYFDKTAKEEFLKDLDLIIENVLKEYKVKIEKIEESHYPMVDNDKNLVQELKRILLKTSDERCPIKASEDFSEFQKVVPGCFFFYAVGEGCGERLHCPNYNFNDEMIDSMCRDWYTIMSDRLEISK